jgi:hypothetical protein
MAPRTVSAEVWSERSPDFAESTAWRVLSSALMITFVVVSVMAVSSYNPQNLTIARRAPRRQGACRDLICWRRPRWRAGVAKKAACDLIVHFSGPIETSITHDITKA